MSDRSDNRDRRDESRAKEKPPHSVQESILTALAFDPTWGAKIAAAVQPRYFDEDCRPLAELLLDYRRKYREAPGRAHLDELVDTFKGEAKEKALSIEAGMVTLLEEGFNPEFVADEVAVWLGKQLRKHMIIRAGELFDNVSNDEFDREVLADLQAAQSISMVEPPKVMTAEEFCALRLEPPNMLIEPWLESGTSVLLHSPAGQGKTALAMYVAIRLAQGRLPIFTSDAEGDYSNYRWPVLHPARVLYVDAEMSPEASQRRLERFARKPAGFFMLNLKREKQAGLHFNSLYDPSAQAWLDRYIAACRADVVVLDNVFHLFGVALDKELEQWSRFNNTWIAAHTSSRRSLLFLHHEPKASPGSSFGTVAREIGVDVRMALAPIKSQPSDGSTTRRVDMHKGRELDGTQKESFVARLRLDKDTNRYRWTAEELPEGHGRPGRPKTAKADERRQRIYELHDQGLTNQEIADEVGCSKQHVGQVLKQTEPED